MAHGAGLAAPLAPACTARPVRLAAGLWSENITEHTGVLDLKQWESNVRPCVKQMGNTNQHNTC